MRIIVATHNEGKLAEINRILEDCLGADAARVELVSAGSLNLPDPVEDGVTFQENALIKARDVAARTGCPAIADDSGLIVDVMGNAPGILSARWAGRHGDDKANNALLLAQMADIPDAKRTARFRCAAALVMPETEAGAGANGRYAIGSETVKTGEMPGVLLHELMASMVSDMTRCSCPTISPPAPSKRRETHVRTDGTGRKERHFPPRQGLACSAAVRSHLAEVREARPPRGRTSRRNSNKPPQDKTQQLLSGAEP